MPETEKNESEKRSEEIISRVLRWGVFITSFIVLIGTLIFLFESWSEIPNYKHFDGELSKYNTLSGIMTNALAFNGLGIIQFGLLLLILVPTVRVAVSIYTFGIQKDFFYVGVSIIVLAVLIYSFMSANV